MKLNTVLQKALKMLWNYRALWLFGAILALVETSTIYPVLQSDQQENDQWIRIIINNATIRLPGADLIIDLTAPEGIRITTPDGRSWREFRDLVEVLDHEASINLWPILIEFAVILVCTLVLSVTARYVVETAMIRMVNEAEETGRHLSVKEGLRRGWSPAAWRLFLIDLVVNVLAFSAFIVAFGLAVTPVLLAIGSHEAIIITAGIGTFGLLILTGYLGFAASVVLSFLMQPIRRACVLEDHGLWASIRQGATLTKHHLKDVGLIWVIWMGFRVVWAPVSVLIAVMLSPLLFITMLGSAALSGIPALLVAIPSSLFVNGFTPWIMGAMAGLPVFMIATISPILFVNGLMEVYLSSMWTVAYRDLKKIERTVQVPVPQGQAVPTHGTD